jgi:archaellum component FlaG (FlaF/FlaG flagellin family)
MVFLESGLQASLAAGGTVAVAIPLPAALNPIAGFVVASIASSFHVLNESLNVTYVSNSATQLNFSVRNNGSAASGASWTIIALVNLAGGQAVGI